MVKIVEQFFFETEYSCKLSDDFRNRKVLFPIIVQIKIKKWNWAKHYLIVSKFPLITRLIEENDINLETGLFDLSQ